MNPVLNPIKLCLCTCLILLSACSKPPEIIKLSGPAQGTSWNITFWNTENINADELKVELETELQRIDKLLSNYRDDSHISEVNYNQTLTEIPADPELIFLIEQARNIQLASQGCYDLTIQPLFKLWGFRQESLHIPSEAEIAEAMRAVGMEKIQTHEKHLQKKVASSYIDVSSIAKGYTVGKLAGILERKKIVNYLVEVGGELQTRGQKPEQQPWRVAIERPLPLAQGFQKVVTLQTLETTAIATSGTYRNYYDAEGKRYSHILDARTGTPVNHATVSATVINSDPTLADAWATALLCLGTEAGVEIANQHQLAVLFIDQQETELFESTSDAFKKMQGISVE